MNNPTSSEEIHDLTLTFHEQLFALIKSKEDQLDHELQSLEKKFLIDSITAATLRQIHKYVSGSKKYGDSFLSDVDHIQEALNECADLTMYLNGALQKQYQFDKRFES